MTNDNSSEKKKTGRYLLRAFLFALGFVAIFLIVSPVFNVSNKSSEHAEMVIKGYYDYPENQADIVFIGNSYVFAFWQDAFAFREKGVASATFASGGMPGYCAIDVTEEALKTQNPKVICIPVRMFMMDDEEDSNKIYYLIPNMKLSATKFRMIRRFCDYLDIAPLDRIDYYIPFFRFHSRWEELQERDFSQIYESYLNSNYVNSFLADTVKKCYRTYSSDSEPMPEDCEKVFRDYLDYCKEKDLPVLFYFSPYWGEDNHVAKTNNYIKQILDEYGFEYIDYNDKDNYEALQITDCEDMYNLSHANIRGSFKFTLHFADYLITKYNLQDRREDPAYSYWQKGADGYYELAGAYLKY